MDEIHKIAKEYDLIVIEDGAHALGSVYKGKKVGTMSDMTTFSFQKNDVVPEPRNYKRRKSDDTK